MKTDYSPHTLSCCARAGYENLSAWADLLDTINVYPVPDGDTGMNLRVSLAPLRDCDLSSDAPLQQMKACGHGNSGNIAVAFFCEFLRQGVSLSGQAATGRDRAFRAISRPRSGTMLDVFDGLCRLLAESDPELPKHQDIREHLQRVVAGSRSSLPQLEAAGVVDAGALGMFLFFDGFFRKLSGGQESPAPLPELFSGMLSVADSFVSLEKDDHCVEFTLATDDGGDDLPEQIGALGSSAVISSSPSGLKVHLHTEDPADLRQNLARFGKVQDWTDECMDSMARIREESRFCSNRVRIMTDAAASIPLALARSHGLILLDSYILTSGQAVPESLFAPGELYALMRKGQKVTTAQASNEERHLHYQAACSQHNNVLYIATGSAFTGNYATALAWKKGHDAAGNMEVVDSGAASGRLALIALLAARLAATGASMADLLSYVSRLVDAAKEYVFINEMKYLVAGGRVSRTRGLFADIFHMKPVISPMAEGVRRMAVLRSREAQLEYVFEKLDGATDPLLLLQYTDNKQWLSEDVAALFRRNLPGAEILLLPLSLTSGVHMGPGTWSVAVSSSRIPA